jgi:hypothetical protein
MEEELMNYGYDVSNLAFAGTLNSLVPQTVHASGSFSWNDATQTGLWTISVPFNSYSDSGQVDLGAWINPTGPPFSVEFTPLSFHISYQGNNDTRQGDVQMNFVHLLNGVRDDVTGTFNVQDDSAPYTLSGTISGYLLPQVPSVPEPEVLSMLLLGLVLGAALMHFKRPL